MTPAPDERRVIHTDDGSASIYAPAFDASYHSTHGALQESRHVFVAAGLAHVAPGKDVVHVLECGFGTGLNLFASLAWVAGRDIKLDYTGLEAFPLSPALLSATDYGSLPGLAPLVRLSPKLISDVHASTWPSDLELDGALGVLRKRNRRIETLEAESVYDVVYYDAFAPRAQPELWTQDVFARLHRALKPGGVLVTYCVQGQVRRDLEAVGFDVVKLPGPPGKREMTRATRAGQ